MASPIPPVNATLTRIYAPTSVPSGGGGTTTIDAQVWAGTAPAFSTERNRVEAGSTAIVNVYDATVAIPTGLIAELVTGMTLAVARNGQTLIRRVTQVEDRADFGFIRATVVKATLRT